MISKKMEKALNKQVNAEFYAAYLYLSMSAYCESINLPGFAGWLMSQTQEELGHAMRIYGHINERGGKVILDTIEKPPSDWKSPLDAFKAAFGHEQKVTGMINDLVNLAIDEKDHASNAFLQWFVTEQVEEEMNTNDAVQKLKLAKDAPDALLMLDREMGARKPFLTLADISSGSGE